MFFKMGDLSVADLKEANTIVTDIMQVLRKAQPKNQHLAALSIQLKAMIAANPEKLHKLIGDYVIRPHRSEIMAANDSFIDKLQEEKGDIIGLGGCYKELSVEEKASILYGLMRLAGIMH